MKLTDSFLRKAKPTGKVQKHSDGGGLYLQVTPTGGKLWWMGYRFEDKQKTLSFGVYPHVSLKEAREKRDEAKAQLAAGIDPGLHKKAVKAVAKANETNSFEIVACEWFAKHKTTWDPHHAQKIHARLERDVFPFVGARPINEITLHSLPKKLQQTFKERA